jgi:hypothetical protein
LKSVSKRAVMVTRAGGTTKDQRKRGDLGPPHQGNNQRGG